MGAQPQGGLRNRLLIFRELEFKQPTNTRKESVVPQRIRSAALLDEQPLWIDISMTPWVRVLDRVR